jgi:hypothetical protein
MPFKSLLNNFIRIKYFNFFNFFFKTLNKRKKNKNFYFKINNNIIIIYNILNSFIKKIK